VSIHSLPSSVYNPRNGAGINAEAMVGESKIHRRGIRRQLAEQPELVECSVDRRAAERPERQVEAGRPITTKKTDGRLMKADLE